MREAAVLFFIRDRRQKDIAADFYINRTRLLTEWLEDEAADQFSDREKEGRGTRRVFPYPASAS